MPQGLLLLSALFSYAMIALNQLALVAMPTYSTYGSQHYMVMENGTAVVKPCDNRSPPGFYSFIFFLAQNSGQSFKKPLYAPKDYASSASYYPI